MATPKKTIKASKAPAFELPPLVKEEDDIDFIFSAGDDGLNPFNPAQAYNKFMSDHSQSMTIQNMNTFLVKAKQAKEMMRGRNKSEMTFTFGTWTLTLKNNHHPAHRNDRVTQDDLTINRVSGFIAYTVYRMYQDPKNKDMLHAGIVNPIAESKGVTWSDGPRVYLSFLPGSEMFMLEFGFFPLAVGLARCHKENMDIEYLRKPMRQVLSDGTKPASWLGEKIADIKKAHKVCMSLKFAKTGFNEAMQKFLSEFEL
ncbi:N protein [Ness Ziona virus]|uniref:Nucleoprotein n=1 Tax=Ness Ziona virus TaxID=2544873 RepID=A0A481U7V2_9VIRU|nr:N protein [Ness Ziona virus]QBH98894.1 N protein [Ness Ziona virus]